ncbi:MAG: UvrB/UvrC motif-containing protein [Nitrosopumilaceae archaeon]
MDGIKNKSTSDLSRDAIDIEATMKKYAEDLDFERAIECRERISRIQKEIEKKDERK